MNHDQVRKEYSVIVERIEELLATPENIENPDAKGVVELNLPSDLVADFEERHHPIEPLTRSEKANSHLK